MARGQLTANDVRGVQPLLASLHFELHHLTLGEGLNPSIWIAEKCTNTSSPLLLNEAVPLVIEPLHFLCHSVCLLQSHAWALSTRPGVVSAR